MPPKRKACTNYLSNGLDKLNGTTGNRVHREAGFAAQYLETRKACQVRVVISSSFFFSSFSFSFSFSFSSAGPQPRPSMLSVPCRTSTTTSHAQCSLPDLNHDQPCPVFPAGPQPRPATPCVPCHTSTLSQLQTEKQTHNHKHITTNTTTKRQFQTH